ncbi:MAG: glutamyl-tRNA reductase [Verrucomicrobiota bacterium]|nr:glutamyl-tRNA reductase [Chthoniobacterales bacterium]MDQ3414313.1 glutamyl-tRNA reductase [Verrucomicrobiota bacterium]
MNLFCVGLSHHTANVETRERFIGHAAIDRILREALGCSEAIFLTTCNRVEVYAASEQPIPTQRIAQCLLAEGMMAEDDEIEAFYRHEAQQCVQHLFRVASGLDSMVIGETEILGQVKKAYAAARESGAAGPLLHRLFQRAFRVAKQVRTKTGITRGAVSIGSVAVDLAEQIFGHFVTRKVLLLGAGEASERTARALVKRGVRDIRVTNRSPERAVALAALIEGRAVAMEDWESHCREVDILISSTAAATPLVTREKLAPLLHDRLDRPLFIIDIAVPRDVAPDVNEMEGVFLYDIDSLRSIAQQSLDLRRQQIAAGEEIIARHVDDFSGWFVSARERGSNSPQLGDPALRVSES